MRACQLWLPLESSYFSTEEASQRLTKLKSWHAKSLVYLLMQTSYADVISSRSDLKALDPRNQLLEH